MKTLKAKIRLALIFVSSLAVLVFSTFNYIDSKRIILESIDVCLLTAAQGYRYVSMIIFTTTSSPAHRPI